MGILKGRSWKCKYTPNDGDLLKEFYIPALSCATRYDRTTGYFSAETLAAASIAVEELVRNNGHMKLIVGCTLDEKEVEAIKKGEELRDTVEAKLMSFPLDTDDSRIRNGLELLAWMIANKYLEVKVAIPCDRKTHQPCANVAIFHEKAGIIEDKTGDRLVFNGSLNETIYGWTKNWDTFHVFRSWTDDVAHLNEDEASFRRLWSDQEPSAKVLELGDAVRKNLLRYLPENERIPARLEGMIQSPHDITLAPTEDDKAITGVQGESEIYAPEQHSNEYRDLWQLVHTAPMDPVSGELIGEVTAAVTPWPHQVKAFERMYRKWPPRLLIADEVGLGKTVQAGLVIRQAWLSGKAKRILILAPKAVLRQWQLELREKFNLNFPIYEDGKLQWYPSPALEDNHKKDIADDEWYKEPFIIASSHLMRRKDRTRQLLEDAEKWDLVILDEAHHARRKGGMKDTIKDIPNQLLRLMRGLKDKTDGLVLLTATPMQVHPLEVWDLLNLLDLPPEWTAENFLKFFELSAMTAPDENQLLFMSRLFTAMERHFQSVLSDDEAIRMEAKHSKITTNKVLKALRDGVALRFRSLKAEDRRFAIQLMKKWSPTRLLISRHTRELLRRYHQAGKLSAKIAIREVEDFLVPLSQSERTLYEAVEDYISSTYNNASPDDRTAIGFVMTIYRRRLASSFYALAQTLQNRLDALSNKTINNDGFSTEDLPDDEIADDVVDSDDANAMEIKALEQEEAGEIKILLDNSKSLPTDTKAKSALAVIRQLRSEGYEQVIIFTQYTDSLDFLRKVIAREYGAEAILCFSGRGGERWRNQGWEKISREKTKELFRNKAAEILLCTDAAAEGLNFQFCGALINYDMPWNPMRVEQRIGRIDRLGQVYDKIRIVNLMYENTVETDVYSALRDRINLFGSFVGNLQPILSRLPKAFTRLSLTGKTGRDGTKEQTISDITADIQNQEKSGFDLDEITDADLEMPVRPTPPYDLQWLGNVLANADMLPPGYEAKPLAGGKDFSYSIPGHRQPIRVTTDPDFYEQHSESVELWSPGSPAFPWKETAFEDPS